MQLAALSHPALIDEPKATKMPAACERTPTAARRRQALRPAAQAPIKRNEHGTKMRPRLMCEGLGVRGVCTKTSCHRFCVARAG